MIRKRELIAAAGDRKRSYAVRCSACFGQYSADPGDYWQWRPDDEIPFECCEGAEFELGREVQQWVPFGADSAPSKGEGQ